MKIAGLQKLSLVDFDGITSATIFTYGCNFACPFCHNGELVIGSNIPIIAENEIFDFLKKRKGLLEGVVISGGEPTLYEDLPTFIKKIKDLGYTVKLDTNGTNPKQLKHLLTNKLIDYVAMDIKNSLEKYSITCGNKNINISNIVESISLLKQNAIPYEFRTTVISEFHTLADIVDIAKVITGVPKYFLQKYIDSENCIERGFTPIPTNRAQRFIEELTKRGINAHLRGYE